MLVEEISPNRLTKKEIIDGVNKSHALGKMHASMSLYSEVEINFSFVIQSVSGTTNYQVQQHQECNIHQHE